MGNLPMPATAGATAALIPLQEYNDAPVVLGRDLHAFLEVQSNYREWFPRMVAYGFEEGKDYASKNRRVQDSLGREREATDHIITLDMAKEISMIQRTDKGKQARQYFIECEKQAKQATPALTEDEIVHQALAITSRKVKELEARNEELEPKATAYDTFIGSDGTYSVGNVAKMLGVSQNKLFDLLRNSGIMIAKGAMRNTPYQRYMHHFTVKASNYERSNGERGTSYTTRVQPSGIDFIARKLGLYAFKDVA